MNQNSIFSSSSANFALFSWCDRTYFGSYLRHGAGTTSSGSEHNNSICTLHESGKTKGGCFEGGMLNVIPPDSLGKLKLNSMKLKVENFPYFRRWVEFLSHNHAPLPHLLTILTPATKIPRAETIFRGFIKTAAFNPLTDG